jgi:hypothetical protein
MAGAGLAGAGTVAGVLVEGMAAVVVVPVVGALGAGTVLVGGTVLLAATVLLERPTAPQPASDVAPVASATARATVRAVLRVLPIAVMLLPFMR